MIQSPPHKLVQSVILKTAFAESNLADKPEMLVTSIDMNKSTDQKEEAVAPGVAALFHGVLGLFRLCNSVSRLLVKASPKRLPMIVGDFERRRRTAWQVMAGMPLVCLAWQCQAWSGPINPYHMIAARNVFGLRPPAASAKATPGPVAPFPTILLTGITTVLGNERAFLEITAPAKPGQSAPKPQSCMLTVGQSEGGVEVIGIDAKLEHVTVSAGGKVVTLTFEQNGKKTHPAPAIAQHNLPVIRNPYLRGTPPRH